MSGNSAGRLIDDSNHARSGKGVKVTLDFTIDLSLVRKQKRALIGLSEGSTVTFDQQEAAEGMLNMIDYIQDAILEQGLASEEEVYPKLPQLFESQPSILIDAA
ncbi:hypothetical protein ACFPT7_07255 [Acidicapsa dinghuensis]|uniref:Uncharacterized protein n=1 Tax=Acidicapsa dinghuensis TaxID=2218256 RepID=A0ABW1EDG7_9BACT|nr:hypothetical protein [Acidicapsa dinghuensis]